MKSYMSDKQMRLVGKGWEVRNHLRRLAGGERGAETTLSELLGGISRDAAKLGTHTPQPRKPQQSTPDLRVVPFPSR
jgi:hypothetical protein